MILDWKGKIAARPWMRTLSDGFTQIFTRVLGTTIVITASPQTVGVIWSNDTQISAGTEANTAIAVVWSEG